MSYKEWIKWRDNVYFKKRNNKGVNDMSSTWNSRIGKFPKKDPNHGWLWNKIKHDWNKAKCWLGFKKCCGGKCKNK